MARASNRYMVQMGEAQLEREPVDDLTGCATAVIVGRMVSAFRSLHRLWSLEEADDAHILLRLLMELRIQLLWLLDDLQESSERALRYFQWTRVEFARFSGIDIRGESAELSGSPEFYLRELREFYGLPDSLRHRGWEKWYEVGIAQLAKDIGREDEIKPLYGILSGFVHGSPFSILRAQFLEEEGLAARADLVEEESSVFVIEESMRVLCDAVAIASAALAFSPTEEVQAIVEYLASRQDAQRRSDSSAEVEG